MKDFIQFLYEDGAKPGILEVGKITVDTAYQYAKGLFKKKGKDLDEEIPDFHQNFKEAQSKAGLGKTVRKDMPVIEDKDVKLFQDRLKKGYLDVRSPYSELTKTISKFPEGLKGDKAKEFLKSGQKNSDGRKPDDKVNVNNNKVRVGDLKPIQKQIYFDKSIGNIAKSGAKDSEKFLKKTSYIVSNDLYIIDGHHRYLSAVLLDPDMKVNVVKVDLPIKDLLKLSLAYGDAIGNKRNA